MTTGATWTRKSSSPERKCQLGMVKDFSDANARRSGGGVKLNAQTGQMEQMDDQDSDSAKVTIFSNNQREMVPIILIVGLYFGVLSGS